MAKSFGETERFICSLFKTGEQFTYKGNTCVVAFSGKPVCKKGEPKTDIYVAAKSVSSGEPLEIKISFKQRNADFLENKTNAERAEQLFGGDWRSIITAATSSISTEFANRPLIYKSKKGKTDKGAITLGWKFELVNKPGGELSGKIPLTQTQLLDVYAGTNLAPDKRNAAVNGNSIMNSGIATHILFDDVTAYSIQDAVDGLIPVTDYIDTHPNIFFACKALNYRTFKQKYDGNRPLSVHVDWSAASGKLTGNLVFGKPLTTCGNDVAARLLAALRQLGVTTTDDLTPQMLDRDVNVYA